ncbi:hypothetical protein EYF80_021771 [Liparis tanakae]|uniref:Uncharacterized protein n=1 Tax=Liparis tanakae TaxID=230148 RepID=A0A4Z2HQ68_9TELE|nr:hypothetical protein EYF80_021771 [Liparis tanakae]
MPRRKQEAPKRAAGPDSINPACVMITVPPCQQVSEGDSVRERKKGRGGGKGGGAGGGDDEETKSGGVTGIVKKNLKGT